MHKMDLLVRFVDSSDELDETFTRFFFKNYALSWIWLMQIRDNLEMLENVTICSFQTHKTKM